MPEVDPKLISYIQQHEIVATYFNDQLSNEEWENEMAERRSHVVVDAVTDYGDEALAMALEVHEFYKPIIFKFDKDQDISALRILDFFCLGYKVADFPGPMVGLALHVLRRRGFLDPMVSNLPESFNLVENKFVGLAYSFVSHVMMHAAQLKRRTWEVDHDVVDFVRNMGDLDQL